MTRSSGLLLLALAFCGCPDPDPPPPPPPPPPQVFLTMNASYFIGESVKGKVNVSGCKNVAQVQLLHQDAFLTEVPFTKLPTEFTLAPGLFSPLYSRLGIALPLTLKAKVVCDDGRTNNSTPVGVKFFPAQQKFVDPNGQQLVPDNFVAEGGLGGSANTFLGCVLTQTGTTIARVDLQGQILQFIQTMPFPCSLDTQISDVSAVTGTRWVLEKGAGAFVMQNSSLQILKELRDPKTSRMGVGKNGQAVVWIDESGRSRVIKMDPRTDASNDWTYPASFINPVRLYGIMNSNPVIDDGAGSSVWITDWRFDVGSKRGTIIPFQLDLNTGNLRNGVPALMGQPAAIIDQQYPLDPTSMPIIPEGVFNADGTFFTVPAIALDAQTTTILSCSTSQGLCEGAARRWSSTQFPGILRAVVPFSQGNIYAIIGPYSVYFLNGTLGNVINLAEQPLQPGGSQIVVGVQPGLGTDFYIMTGPDFGPGMPSFATEIIATDSPMSGELWRLEYGSGESSGNAMWMGVDDAAQVWVRIGTDLVKPLPLTQYREARGATVVP